MIIGGVGIPKMKDRDWIKRRAACSLGAVFDALEVAVRKDLARLKHRTPWKGDNLIFGEREDTFHVRNPHTGHTVYFGCERKRIEAIRATPDGLDTLILSVKPAINMKGQCVLKTKEGETLDGWQFRMRALEELFFGESILDEKA